MNIKMENIENFKKLVSGADDKALEQLKWRVANRIWLRESRKIAFRILDKLDEMGWTQKKLALELNVSPQYISKLVKGNENLTLETISRIQYLLDIPLLASCYEGAAETVMEFSMEAVSMHNGDFNENYTDQSHDFLIKLENKRA